MTITAEWLVAILTALAMVGGMLKWWSGKEKIINDLLKDIEALYKNFAKYQDEHEKSHRTLDKRLEEGTHDFESIENRLFDISNKISNLELQNKERKEAEDRVFKVLGGVENKIERLAKIDVLEETIRHIKESIEKLEKRKI